MGLDSGARHPHRPEGAAMTWRRTSLQQAAQHALEPIARLEPEPEELGGRLGLSFDEGNDDLDDFAAAAITVVGQDAEPVTVAFLRYRHAPDRGCELHAPGDAEPAAILRRLTATTALEATDVIEWWDGQRWRHGAGPSPTATARE